MRIVSLTYINSHAFDQPLDWINRLYAFTGILEELSREHTVMAIEQINYEGDLLHKGVQYYFRNYGNGVNRFPVRLHRFLETVKPDVVLVRGLHFPLQLIQLRKALGKKVVILGEHHADKPSTGWKKKLNRLAGRYVNAFHFTSAGNAEEWISSGNISNKNKCREIPAGSTYFSGYDKMESRQRLGWGNGLHFIWTGRLDSNKDPLTVIQAFRKFLWQYPQASLHMIFMTAELLPAIKEMMEKDIALSKAVILHGKIEQPALEHWYSAADFYISASYYEGGSIALTEAMACGCIPITSAIPSSVTATANGRYGFHFKPGSVDELHLQLQEVLTIDIKKMSQEVKNHFRQELSFEAIAKKFIGSCRLSMNAKQ